MAEQHIDRIAVVRSLADDVRRFARAGESGAVAVVGAVGLGKTTVLEQLTTRLDDLRVVHVEADEFDAHEPYSVARRVFTPDVAVPDPGVLERQADNLDEMCGGGPVVLVVDDAHLADSRSLSLLYRTGVASRRVPLAVVLAYRRTPERSALTMFAAQSHTRTVELAPLTATEVRAWVRCRLGGDPDTRLLDHLGHAGGNPLHVDQLLGSLQRNGRITVDADTGSVGLVGSDVELTDELVGSIRVHLARLSPRVRDLVHLLSVADGPTAVGELAAAGGTAPAPYAGSVADAVDSGVVHWHDEHRVDFVSPAHRRIAYDTIPRGVRPLLHRAVANAWVRSGVPAERIAEQLRRAGEPGAFVSSRQPGSVRMFGMFDPDETAATASRNPDLARAALLAEAGRIREAAELADRVLECAEGSDRVFASTVRMATRTLLADLDDAVDAIDDLLVAALPPETSRWLRQYRRWLGAVGGTDPVSDDAPPAPDDADLSEFDLDTILPGVHAVLAGDAIGGLALFERGRSAARDRGDGDTRPAGMWPMWAALHAHGPIAAFAHRSPVVERAPTVAEMWLLPVHHAVTASTLFALGRWDECLRACDAASAVVARTDSGWTSPSVAVASLVDVYRGDLESARARLDGGDGLRRVFGFPDVEYARAELFSASGQHRAASETAGEAWRIAADGRRLVWMLQRGPQVARIALRADDQELFATVCAVMEGAVTSRCPALAVSVDFVEALSKSDDVRLMETSEAFAALGDVLGELSALEEAAVTAAEGGRREESHGYARRAHDLAVHLGARTVAERVASRLRGAGVHLGTVGRRRTARTGWESLTDAERRVALLVAQGLSGPQIAVRLGISPRTVQTHVSHALAKLGLHSRVGLAREALAHDPGS